MFSHCVDVEQIRKMFEESTTNDFDSMCQRSVQTPKIFQIFLIHTVNFIFQNPCSVQFIHYLYFNFTAVKMNAFYGYPLYLAKFPNIYKRVTNPYTES